MSSMLKFTCRQAANDVLVSLFFTAASILGPIRYIYGIFDCAITVVFSKSAGRPGLFSRDLIASESFATYVFDGIGLLWAHGVSIESSYFLLYALALFAAFLAAKLLGELAASDPFGGYLAMLLLLFSPMALGTVPVVDRLFTTRLLALPLVLFSYLACAKKRYAVSFFLCGALSSIHVLTAAFLAAILFTRTASGIIARERPPIVMCAGSFLVGALPFLLRFVLFPGALTPAGDALVPAGEMNAEWMSIIRATSSHHLFPFSWPVGDFIKLFAWAGLGWVCAAYADIEIQKLVRSAIVAVFGLSIFGTVFSEIYPVQSLFRWQFFRATACLVPLVQIAYAAAFATMMRSDLSRRWKLLTGTASYPLFYSALGSIYAYTGFLLFTIVVTGIRNRRLVLPSLISLVLVLAVHAYAARGPFFISSIDWPKWREAQGWAKENAPIDSLFFVPPTSEGFRIESERSVYAEHRDATLGIFNREFAMKWKSRIEGLGSSVTEPSDAKYREMTADDFRALAKENGWHSNLFVVTAETGVPSGPPPVFNNGAYTITEVSFLPTPTGSDTPLSLPAER